jgi:glycosyltransferase involved in cell wall biosynthesis
MPTISVIVPVYNVEPYIRECLDSLIAQTYTDFEVILVDDASPDGCPAICDEYAAKDNRFKAVHHSENRRISAARNTGLDHAVGRYIAFVDPDDYCYPDCLEVMHTLMETHKADLVMTMRYNERTLRHKKECDTVELLSQQETFHIVIYEVHVYGRLFVREIIEKQKLKFDETICHDEDTLFTTSYLQFVRLAVKSGIITYYYRMTPLSVATRKHNLEKELSVVAVSQKLHEIYSQSAPDLLYIVPHRMVNSYIRIAVCYARIGQKKESKEYLRKARATARELWCDKEGPLWRRIQKLVAPYCPNTYITVWYLYKVTLPQTIISCKRRINRKGRTIGSVACQR